MITRQQLAADLRSRVFGLGGRAPTQPTIGAELEFLPLRAGDHSVMPLFGRRSIASFVRDLARHHAWREHVTSADIPWFSTPSGGMISFEPGGQIEYSSPPCRSVNALLADLETWTSQLFTAASRSGIDLVTVGIDPYNDITSAPLQLRSSRYANMARYFESIGPAGAMMMRQTAAIQVNVGLGPEPIRRWRLLNALAAPLIALFANSRIYAGKETGFASYRAQVWRETDALRTGVFAGGANVTDEYLDFALKAPVILSPYGDRVFRPFEHWIELEATLADWRGHLTTLFPEVRPKGHFELRSIDAQSPDRHALVLSFISGLVLDEATAREAAALLPPATPELLQRAGQAGIQDRELHALCLQLSELAWTGCRRLGEAFLEEAVLARAQEEWSVMLESGACA